MAGSDVVICFPPQTLFTDKDTGAPLSGGKVYFYSQDNPTAPKNIYQQTELPSGEPGYSLLNNPVILTSIGSFGDDSGNDINVYLYPYVGSPTDLSPGEPEQYYITVESATGVQQFTRMFWPPNTGSGGGSSINALSSTNQITNSQFIETLFITPATFTVSGTDAVTQIAPGWSVLTSGSGTVTVSQVALAFANSTNGTNAPYALQIESSSLDAISLYQRFEADPLLLSGGFVSGYAQVASLNGSGSQPISLQYQPSSGGTPVNIITAGTAPDESFTKISATVAIPATNTDVAPTGYVDFVVVLPKNIRIQITSVQLVGATALASTPSYLPLSTQLQTSNLYWYDKPALDYKPIPSYLIGWDFPFNPAQFLGNSGSLGAIGANKSAYIWDQTIAFQTVNNSLGFSRNADTSSLVITPSLDTSFALVQYLGQTEARDILNQKLSVQLQASTSATTLSGTVSLYWTDDTTLPDLNSADYKSLVSGITAGVPAVLNGTWNKVDFVGDGNATFTLIPTADQFSFSGFDAISSAGKTTATFFAIVVAFDTLAAASTMTIDYCSLVGGTIPTRPAYQSVDQVLRQCQYYYETSYNKGIVPGTASGDGDRRFVQFASYPGTMNTVQTIAARATQFNIVFDSVKRTITPTIKLYNPIDGVVDTGYWVLVNGGVVVAGTNVPSSNWSLTNISNKAVSFNSVGNAGGPSASGNVQGPSSYITFQYTCDARLGLVT